MAIDNDVYSRDAEHWRDPNHSLSMLGPFAVPRAQYVHRSLNHKATNILDVGCGGGLLAEEMAKLGYRVSAVDPSEGSITAARDHAREVGLDIAYRTSKGEALPYGDSEFDAVYCLDVLEHVDDLDQVIAEIARVLKPRGCFVFDTINRTLLSKLVAIKVLQEWPSTRVMPPDFHEWSRFIKPAELRAYLEKHGLAVEEFVGMFPRGNPLSHLQMLRKRAQGKASYRDVGRYIADRLDFGSNMSVSYAGYATKR